MTQKFFDNMLPIAKASARDDPGQLVFDVLERRGKPKIFLVYEVDESQAALDDHKQTSHYRASRDVVTDLIDHKSCCAQTS